MTKRLRASTAAPRPSRALAAPLASSPPRRRPQRRARPWRAVRQAREARVENAPTRPGGFWDDDVLLTSPQRCAPPLRGPTDIRMLTSHRANKRQQACAPRARRQRLPRASTVRMVHCDAPLNMRSRARIAVRCDILHAPAACADAPFARSSTDTMRCNDAAAAKPTPPSSSPLLRRPRAPAADSR